MPTKNGTWPVAKAKAHLSSLIDRAIEEGPQTITRSGRDAVVVIAAADWKRRTKRKGTLVEFLASSPLRGSGVRIAPRSSDGEEIEL
jgi:prevent-host-death family protein